MEFTNFYNSLQDQNPPQGISNVLLSLWYDARGDWAQAHNTVQDIPDEKGSWVHAYLHRKEGDEGNASYWYHRAHKIKPSCSLEEEWKMIVQDILKYE